MSSCLLAWFQTFQTFQAFQVRCCHWGRRKWDFCNLSPSCHDLRASGTVHHFESLWICVWFFWFFWFFWWLTSEVGSELIQKYLGEGPKLVPAVARDLLCIWSIWTWNDMNKRVKLRDSCRCEKCSESHKNTLHPSFSSMRSMQLPQRGSLLQSCPDKHARCLGESNVQHSLVLNFLNRYDTTSGGEKEIQRTMWLGHEYSKVSMANPAPPTPRPENSFARGSAFPRQFQ